ncbi:MAG: efflux RND transporter permease subunit, partial [Verrucomicrobiales bacterium]
VGIALSRDRSDDYQERVSLLLRNGTLGLVLVLLGLGLFLELRVAFWTAVGIPVSILGSLTLLPVMDASINMLSLFGFIVTLWSWVKRSFITSPPACLAWTRQCSG